MIILLLLILAIIVFIAIFNIKLKFNILFIMIMAGISVIIFGLVMYISNLSYYIGIIDLETVICHILRKLMIKIENIKLIVTLGYGVIFTSEMLIFLDVASRPLKRKRVITIVSSVIILLFVLINNTVISDHIYIRLFQYRDLAYFIMADEFFTVLNYSVIMYFSVLPLYALWTNSLNTRLMFKRKYNYAMIVILLLLEATVILLSVYTNLRDMLSIFVFNHISTNFLSQYRFTTFVPIFAVIILLPVLMIRFGMFNNADYFKKSIINKKMKVLIMDWKYIFHDAKNVMVTIVALKNNVQREYGTQEGLKALNRIEECAFSYAEKIENLLNIYENRTNVVLKEMDIIECLNSVIKRINDESDVPISVVDIPDYSIINGDMYQIETVFYNIIKNSVEAIRSENTKEGRVLIRFIEEESWLCVEIYDNGKGIPKKIIRKIWRPFISTKNTFMNWGIGLIQAKKIVDAHLGHIDIESREGQYTKIQVCFMKDR